MAADERRQTCISTITAIRATGARRIPEVVFGVIPQVVPLWSSCALYRLETNVRSATTLGIVGAGGIGQTLYESIRSFQYAETAAQMLIVVAPVMLIDLVNAWLGKALVWRRQRPSRSFSKLALR